jgi:FSR family fosmidomycin resistance protein-like MFS transporter
VVVARSGRRGLGAFSLCALISTGILIGVGFWYKRHGLRRLDASRRDPTDSLGCISHAQVVGAIAVLLILVFSKFVYLASITSYYTFYLMSRFGLSVQSAQMHLFAILAAAAGGTLAGGALGDRFGRKHVIWFSVLGVLPFTLALPYASLFWTGPISVMIGFILASAFPAIVVYGQELIPNRVGMVSGLFFGLSFGAAGSGAALLGSLADATSIQHVYRVCAFLPALGVLAALLPRLGRGATLGVRRESPRRDSLRGDPVAPIEMQ